VVGEEKVSEVAAEPLPHVLRLADVHKGLVTSCDVIGGEQSSEVGVEVEGRVPVTA